MDDRLAKLFYERNILTRLSEAESDIDLLQKLQTIKSVDLQTLPVPGDSTPPVLSIIIDTDGTLAANSDERVASQRATKTYADTVSSNASVIAKVLTGFAAGAGTVTAADSILSAFQKIVGNLAAMAVGHTIEDEGTPLTQRAKLNFVGGGITATDDSGDNASVVTVSAQTIGDLIEGSTNKATPVDADRFGLWDSVADILKYATWANIKSVLKTYFDTLYQNILTAAIIGDFIVALTGKTTPVDADSILLSDSAASDDGKKVTWANVKATLKTYFDPYYRIATMVEKYGVVSGTMTIGKDAGKVAAAIASGNTTVNFGRTMTPSDWVRFQGPDSVGTLSLEWMLVGSLVSGTTYNVTRNVDGSGANNWLIDTPFVVIGQDGDLRIEMTAGDDAKIYIIRQGATWSTDTTPVFLRDLGGDAPYIFTSGHLQTPYLTVYPNSVTSVIEGVATSGSFYFAGVFSTSVSGTLTDYNPDSANKGLFHALRLNATAATTLESLMYYYSTSFPGSIYSGRFITIMNVGTFNITVKDNYTTGTNADSRFDLGGSDLVIPPDGSVIFWYDGTTEMWRVWSVNQIVGDYRFITTNTGWIATSVAVTSGTLDSPSFELSFAGDMTSLIGLGDRIKLTQSTTKYFIVTKVGAFSAGATIITVYGGTDYALVSSGTTAISNVFYSYIKAPFGFPLSPDKWTVSLADTSNAAQGSPTSGTFYSPLGATTLSVPIGVWRTFFSLTASIVVTTTALRTIGVVAALSTSNSSVSDNELRVSQQVTGPIGANSIILLATREKLISVSAKTTHYLICMGAVTTDAITSIALRGDLNTTVARCVCAYL